MSASLSTVLDWQRCLDPKAQGMLSPRVWCSFEALDTDSLGDVGGVYVIWRETDARQQLAGSRLYFRKTVYVGSSENYIASRIEAHRLDPRILQYTGPNNPPLLVTWAATDRAVRQGVERFLADQLIPLVGESWPDEPPTPVNLPW